MAVRPSQIIPTSCHKLCAQCHSHSLLRELLFSPLVGVWQRIKLCQKDPIWGRFLQHLNIIIHFANMCVCDTINFEASLAILFGSSSTFPDEATRWTWKIQISNVASFQRKGARDFQDQKQEGNLLDDLTHRV